MKHIVLIGDSIFDNALYVQAGESVSEILSNALDSDAKVTLLAVDGNVTKDVPKQLNTLPHSTTHVFLSCGGNDALHMMTILNETATTVGDGLDKLFFIREQFRANYRATIDSVLIHNRNLTVCTVYNKVPEASERALTALALFNEIILEEAVEYALPVIDLRVACRDYGDYSDISPIEPSGNGAVKITNIIKRIVYFHEFSAHRCTVYA